MMLINAAQETYEATQAQQERIHNEIKENQSLISELLSMSSLEKDFEGHEVYLQKLRILMGKYKGIRRVRGDGNCFFRSFGFSFLESLFNQADVKVFECLKERCDYYKNYLIDNGYSEFTVKDFFEQFIELIDSLKTSVDLSKLEEMFNDQGFSDYYIVFLRLIVSSYLQMNVAHYQAFIEEGLTMKQFCEREVEPMYIESDNIHIIALSHALLVNINIENCQNSGDVQCLNFSSDQNNCDSAESRTPLCNITLLYRPGHYDILYEKEL